MGVIHLSLAYFHDKLLSLPFNRQHHFHRRIPLTKNIRSTGVSITHWLHTGFQLQRAPGSNPCGGHNFSSFIFESWSQDYRLPLNTFKIMQSDWFHDFFEVASFIWNNHQIGHVWLSIGLDDLTARHKMKNEKVIPPMTSMILYNKIIKN